MFDKGVEVSKNNKIDYLEPGICEFYKRLVEAEINQGKLDIEKFTQKKLEEINKAIEDKKMREMNEEIKELKKELEFYKKAYFIAIGTKEK